ncbi:MAG: dynamin family protein [Terriglobales bacterium]
MAVEIAGAPAAAHDLAAYAAAKGQLAQAVQLLLHAAKDGTPRDYGERCRSLLARLAEDRFYLAVVGHFNQGKTTLMNALIGMDRLPTGLVPVTSALTCVRYGSHERLVVHFQGRRLIHEGTLAELADYVSQEGNPGNCKEVQLAEVELPAQFLRRGFALVDTPGLGSAFQENGATTEGFLPEADALILVTSVENPLAADELELLDRAAPARRRTFIALNKIDLASEFERGRAEAFLADRLRARGVVRVYPLSARRALEARLRGDESALAASGLLSLEAAIVEDLARERANEFIRLGCDRILDLLDALGSMPAADLRSRLVTLRENWRLQRVPSVAQLPTDAVLSPLAACPACQAGVRRVFEFLSRYQHDLSTNAELQARHAACGGFCSRHGWKYEPLASPVGVCSAYPALLRRRAADLGAEAESLDAPGAGAPKWLQLDCPACPEESEAESRCLQGLAAQAATEPRRVPVLCLPHFAALLALLPPSLPARTELRRRQAAALERVAENMEQHALKHGALRRGLMVEEELEAHRQGLWLLGGDRRRAG